MYHDPRHHDELYLRSMVDSARERRSKKGLAGTPTIVLIWLLPVLLVARVSMWTWRQITGRSKF